MRLNLVHTLRTAVAAGRKVLLAALLLSLNLFFTRAQDNNSISVRADVNAFDVRIFFRFDDATFRSDYLDNARTLERLDSILAVHGTESLDSVKIVSYSSPEGVYAYNVALSARRAASMRRYLVSAYPSLSSKVVEVPGDESWHDLREMIVSDTRLGESSRKAMLDIIDSSASPDLKEKRLSSLAAYRYLYANYFKKLRYASFRLIFPASEPLSGVSSVQEPARVQEPAPESEPLKDTLAMPAPDSSAVQEQLLGIPVIYGLDDDEDIFNIADEPLRFEEDQNTPAQNALKEIPSCNPPRYRWPLFAVSTNAILDMAFVADFMYFTPNFAVEVPIGQKWSVLGEYTFPWWLNDSNDRAWQLLKWDFGVRRWLSPHNPAHRMDVLNGHFVGLDFGAGYYDIEPLHKGYQGEFQTLGLEYGYAWNLNESWRLDAYVGLGWLGTHYRYYEGDSTDKHLLYKHHGKMDWFGPTKAGVSFKYIFSRSGKNNWRNAR